jgi:dienelactone hydrolase
MSPWRLSSVKVLLTIPLLLLVSTSRSLSSPTILESIDQIEISFESSNYTLYGKIYYPSQKSETYPGIVFCEGFAGYVDAYTWMPKYLAEEGYVVLIFDFPGQGKSEGIFPINGIMFPFINLYVRFGVMVETPFQYLLGRWTQATSDALTYLMEESPVNHLVNTTSIGLIGHSLGALCVTKTAVQDDRVKCLIALTHTNPLLVESVAVPFQLQGGTFDLGYFSIPLLLTGYNKANSPKELIIIKHGTHEGFTSVWGPFCPCPSWQKEMSLHYAIGWLDYFLKNDQEAYEIITTPYGQLSSLIRSRYNFGEGNQFLT